MASTPEAPANEAERRRWNDAYWTSAWPAREELTGAVTATLLGHAALQPGDGVLDVGSGGGRSSLAAGRLVGPAGGVVGADLSQRLVQLARRRAEDEGAANVRFVVTDMQTDAVEGAPFDVAISQFGVMFFDEPVKAFTNILNHVAHGGRLYFACWQSVTRNPWHIGNAMSAFVPPPPPPAPGKSPTGPFSLGDAVGTTELLSAAGWADVQCFAYEVVVDVEGDAIADDRQPSFMGVPDEALPAAREALRRHLTTFDRGDGRYDVPLAYQIFTASRTVTTSATPPPPPETA